MDDLVHVEDLVELLIIDHFNCIDRFVKYGLVHRWAGLPKEHKLGFLLITLVDLRLLFVMEVRQTLKLLEVTLHLTDEVVQIRLRARNSLHLSAVSHFGPFNLNFDLTETLIVFVIRIHVVALKLEVRQC